MLPECPSGAYPVHWGACHDGDMDSSTPVQAATARPALVRRPDEGRVSGVCAGLARHLGLDVGHVRLLTAATSLVGAGVLMYLWLYFTMPLIDRSAPISRLFPQLADSEDPPDPPDSTRLRQLFTYALAGGLALLALVILLDDANRLQLNQGMVAAVIITAGVALSWLQVAALDTPGRRVVVITRMVAGVVLVLVGVGILLAQDRNLSQVAQAAAAGLVIVLGVAVVLAPLVLRLWRDLLDTRAMRVRESERADIAAHLHDSVLQTLALIRAQAADPARVQHLARAQERELRQWLYTSDPAARNGPSSDITSSATLVREAAASVEDRHGVPVDVVISGEGPVDEAIYAMVAAMGEAVTNAAIHGRPPISVYAEFTEGSAEVFIRDRGEGFNLDEIAHDRHGIRHSIIGRMERHGGSATIRSASGRGTDIQLRLTRSMAEGPASGPEAVSPTSAPSPISSGTLDEAVTDTSKRSTS